MNIQPNNHSTRCGKLTLPEDEGDIIVWAIRHLKYDAYGSQVIIPVLENEAYSCKSRVKFARRFINYDVTVPWAYANFESDDLSYLASTKPFTDELVSYAAENPNWTWDSIAEIRCVNHTHAAKRIKKFLDLLPDEVLTQFLGDVLAIRYSEKGYAKYMYSPVSFINAVTHEDLMERTRAIYGLDESIPFSWAIKAIGVLS